MNMGLFIQAQYFKKPYGTIHLRDSLYVGQTEVTNFEWIEFLFSLQQTYGRYSKEYTSALPDTCVWEGEREYLNEYYFRHPAYRNYPVVGITKEQAMAYCTWRSYVASKLFLSKKMGVAVTDHTLKSETSPLIVEYRLPFSLEFEEIMSIRFSERSLKKSIRREEKLSNLKNGIEYFEDLTNSVNSNYPNTEGLYQVLGNVSEMVADNDLAYGGNWSTAEDDMFTPIENKIPSNKVGFRCVVILKSGRF